VGRGVRRRGAGQAVALAEVLADLVGAGFGRDQHDLGERFTWRQLERYFGLIQRARRRARADLTEAVAMGFGGKDLAGYLRRLRKEE
jgi:uncharacterized membrane protein YccC